VISCPHPGCNVTCPPGCTNGCSTGDGCGTCW
jgi:hypothetical protein